MTQRLLRSVKVAMPLLLAVALLATPASAATGTCPTTFVATSILGNQSPPPYGLRLDGFFTDDEKDAVTFAYDSVLFQENVDGTARLHGLVSVAEVNNSGGPGIYASSWILNVWFDLIPATVAEATIWGYNPAYRYYTIQPDGGPELVNLSDANDYANFESFLGGLKPFRIGAGANDKNENFGASGWVTFEHNDNGSIKGSLTKYNTSSDFLMDLSPAGLICPADTTVTACEGDSVCIPGFTNLWPNVTVTGGTLSGNAVCFVASVSGIHTIQVIGSDDCGNADTCEVNIDVVSDCDPAIEFSPTDTILNLCAPTLTCLSYEILSGGAGGAVVTLESPFGGLDVNSQLICFTPSEPGEYCFTIRITDSTGAYAEDSICISVTLNQAPTLTTPQAIDPITCIPQNGIVCISGWSASDPEGDSLVYNAWGGGTFDPATGTFCTNVNVPGQYSQTLIVSDLCGGTDKKTITFEVLENLPPVWISVPDTTLSGCDSVGDSVCVTVIAADPESSSISYEIYSEGSFEPFSGRLCVPTQASGEFWYVVRASDSCNDPIEDTVHILFDLDGTPPGLMFSIPDTTINVCDPDTVICFTVSTLGPTTVVTEILNPGSFNPLTGEVCFNPAEVCFQSPTTVDTTICLIFEATTSCGSVTDTLCIHVVSNQTPVVVLPADTVVYLCESEEICIGPIDVADPEGDNLTVIGIGANYLNSQLCFTPDSSGTYYVGVTATDDCGATASDSVRVDVVFNKLPFITVADTLSAGVCGQDLVCVGPIASGDPDGALLSLEVIDGGGFIDTSTGKLCFTQTGSGVYRFVLKASDECTSVLDTVWVDVQASEPPVWTDVPDLDLSACLPGDSVCFTALAADPEGDDLIMRISALPANGQYEEFNGTFCFLPETSGTYLFEISVRDTCSEWVIDTARITVVFNTLPQLTFSIPDTTLNVCLADTIICFTVGAIDPDDSNVVLREILNPGSFNPATGEVCFNPSEVCFQSETTYDTTICLIFGATDRCSTEVVDSVCIRIVRNRAPVVQAPGDQSVAACNAGVVCVPGLNIFDPDGDSLVITVTGGATTQAPYVSEGDLCFYAEQSGTYELIICATDPCGFTSCDTANIQVDVNLPPTVDLGPTQFAGICDASEICIDLPVVTDPDGPDPQITVEGASIVGDQLCFFADTAGTYRVIVTATDSCGATGSDTVDVVVDANSPPVMFIKALRSVYLCDTDTLICCPIRITDSDGNEIHESLRLVKADGRLWTLKGDTICLDAAAALGSSASGIFDATVAIEDSCGATALATVSIDLTANQPPIAELPPASQVYLCEPGQVCIYPVIYGDPDGGPLDVQVTGGELSGDSICAFVEESGIVMFTLTVTDSCGAVATDTVYIDVEINAPPTLSLPTATALNLCALQEVCVEGIFGSDPELGTLPAELISGPGQFDPETGILCFTVLADGAFSFEFQTTDGCDTISGIWTVQVAANQPPSFDPTPDVSLAACLPGDTVCLQFTATDSDGDAVEYHWLDGPGTLDRATGRVCFVPDTSGVYRVIVGAQDSCGVAVYDTALATVQFNRAPEILFSTNDTTLYLCNPDTLLCFTVTASDPDGESPVITEILNPGTFNPLTGLFCFNPDSVCFNDDQTVDTTICLIFSATDSCGAVTFDTLCLQLIRNRAPSVNLGDDFAMFVCEPGPVCLPLNGSVSDLDGDELQLTWGGSATVSTIDSICFNADTSGLYQVTLCATDPCGLTDCDTLFVQISVNTAPVVVLPEDGTIVACNIGEVCLGPVEIGDSDSGDSLSVVVTGGAQLVGDSLCFTPDGDGLYTFVVTVTDACGATDADTVSVTIDANDPPVLSFSSPDTTIKVCNVDTTLCFVVSATDPDGDIPVIEPVLLPGDFNPLTGVFCFNPDSVCFNGPSTMDTTICVVFKATDACGVEVLDSLCILIQRNRAPSLQFSSSDTALFLCNPDTLLCFNVSATDPEGDAVVISEVRNPGAYFPEPGMFCFNPDSVCFTGLTYDTSICIIFKATDACGNSTIDSLCLELTANHPPVIAAPDTVDVTIRALGDEICISPVFATDVEDGLAQVSVSGAAYDSAAQAFCFIADTAGTYTFIITATDACEAIQPFYSAAAAQAVTSKETVVHVTLNEPPTVTLPGDTSVFLCEPDTVCFDIDFADANGPVSISEITGPAYYDSLTNQICVIFTDETPLTIGVTVIDEHGATASDSMTVTPTFNSAPTVLLPDNFSPMACSLGTFCIGPVSITDPDGNLAGPPLVEGGTFDSASGQICVDVDGSHAYTVVVTAIDSCGHSGSDTITLEISLNLPPVTSFSVPDTSLFLCNADTLLCFTFSAFDPEGGLVLLDEILNPGVFDPLTGEFCFNPSVICFNTPGEIDTTVCLIFSAIDDCGVKTIDTLCLDIFSNVPPVVVAPNDTTVGLCSADSICLSPFSISDRNVYPDTLAVSVSGTVASNFDVATGVLCFLGAPGTYIFAVTATDICGSTTSDSVRVTVTDNTAPTVSLPADFAQLVCLGSTVCVPVTVFDPDGGDTVTIEVISGSGIYNSQPGEVCFPVDTNGVYGLIVRATDRCGATDEDTVLVDVTVNSAPVWVSVPKLDLSLCTLPAQYCLTVEGSDADGGTLVYRMLSGDGNIDSTTGEICFAPSVQVSEYRFVVSVSDSCGASAVDTAVVTIDLNAPPVFQPQKDTLLTQCTPTQICFPPLSAIDPDGDAVVFSLIDGNATLSNGVVCFTPDGTGGTVVYCFTVTATDSCEAADTIQFCATVNLNRPPVIVVPDAFSLSACGSTEICFGGISATDPDGGIITLTMTSGPGSFDAAAGEVCFTPDLAGGVFDFLFSASDTCGATVTASLSVNVTVNSAPAINAPAQLVACVDSIICIELFGTDSDLGDRITISELSGPGGTFNPNPLAGIAPLTGEWCWTPTVPGQYEVIFQVTDSCGATGLDTTVINVDTFCDTLCFAASIRTVCPDSLDPSNWLFQGRSVSFPVTTTISRPVGAFDFLIGFDASALTLLSVTPGDDISAWEFFTYRLVDPNTTCTGFCPSGLVRIVALADINNGVPMSDPSQIQPGSDPREFAVITFQVSNDRTLAGQFVPVQFWWNDCGDNTFSSPEGNLFVSNTVDPDTCVTGGNTGSIQACALFSDGGGCIPRASDIDDRGDLNLNGVAYEIADAVLYTNYFIFGQQVFFIQDPIKLESQIAASDVNADGAVLTVADLVFLIRIILGLEDPIPGGVAARVATTSSAELTWKARKGATTFDLQTDTDVGAVGIELRAEGQVTDVRLSEDMVHLGLTLGWHQTDRDIRIIVYNHEGITIPAGSTPLFEIVGEVRSLTVDVDVSDAMGRTMKSSASASSTLPETFVLHQNYPNPFNPETEIAFRLHQGANVTLTVFNLIGQEVVALLSNRRLEAGDHTYKFTGYNTYGSELPSGVYLYRIEVNGSTQTRKMLLLR